MVDRQPNAAKIREVRVVSWNIAFRGPKAAKQQGDLLRRLAPDLMLLQEVNPGSSAVLADAAGADWMVGAVDLHTPERDDSPVRRRGVAIAGHGLLHPCRSWLLNEIRFSERVLLVGDTDAGNAVCGGELSRAARRNLGNRQAAAGSRLRFLVVYPECAVVVRSRRQYAVH